MLRNLLYQSHTPYTVIRHPATYTAQGTAHAAHISGKMIAKTVVVKIEGEPKMMVLPANHKVNLEELRWLFWTDDVKLVNENELRKLFPDCEIGGMPPFGNLYGMDVYVSIDLTRDREIAFNAGNHSELMKLDYTDYAQLVHPNVMEFETR